MTYDTVSFEVCITETLPDHGAIMGGRPGPIQNRADLERYPLEHLAEMYWNKAAAQFDSIRQHLPAGMKAVGGIGFGVFETSEDLVGYEYLSYMQDWVRLVILPGSADRRVGIGFVLQK